MNSQTREQKEHYQDYIASGIVSRKFNGLEPISYERYCEIIPIPNQTNPKKENKKNATK